MVNAATATECLEGKTDIVVYDYRAKDKQGKDLSPRTLVVCQGCQAHELLFVPLSPRPEVNTKYKKQLWKRLHGWDRLLDGEDKDDPHARKKHLTQDIATLNAQDLHAFLSGKPESVSFAKAFTVVDYTPKE